MRVTEMALSNSSPLYFQGKQLGTIEREALAGRADSLRLRIDCGSFLKLPAAVDISEQLSTPRVFLIEGTPDSRFFVFGGEKGYWLSIEGKVENVLQTFRTYTDAEYWETRVIERPNDVVIIYEAGVLAIDEDLNIKCHKSKLFNDLVTSIEGDSLRLLRDHDIEWHMQLVDGNDLKSS
jgi:hypothetical protein